MNEAAWNECASVNEMLTVLWRQWQGEGWARRVLDLFAGGRPWRPSHRKLRLFACACCRLSSSLENEAALRDAVEMSERYADGKATLTELRTAAERCWQRAASDRSYFFFKGMLAAVGECVTHSDVWQAVDWESVNAQTAAAEMQSGHRLTDPSKDEQLFAAFQVAEGKTQCCLLRCIFGRLPLQSLPTLASSLLDWQNGLIPQMANAIYEERSLPSGHLDPERLCVLADALEETGADASLYEHFRGAGPHVRGCHVVDILLGKE